MMKMKKPDARAWLVAFGIVVLYAGAAHAQSIGGEIPGGDLVLAIGDALVAFVRRNIGPIVVVLPFIAAIIGGLAGSVQQGVGRAVTVLMLGAFLAGSPLWWPYIRGWFA